jgi:hypothetical protein
MHGFSHKNPGSAYACFQLLPMPALTLLEKFIIKKYKIMKNNIVHNSLE